MIISSKIKKILLLFLIIAISCICFCMGFFALKKSMSLSFEFNMQPNIRCELYITPNGGSEEKVFSNLANNEYIHPDWRINLETNTLSYLPNVTPDLGESYTIRVLNYTENKVVAEVKGDGATYNAVVLDAFSSTPDATENVLNVSAVSNNYKLNFYAIETVAITANLYNVEIDLDYQSNTLVKFENNYYLTKNKNFVAKFVAKNSDYTYSISVNTLKINNISQSFDGYVNNAIINVPSSNIINNLEITVSASDSWNGGVATSFAFGSGTVDDPYIIVNGNQLALLRNIINTDNGNTVGVYSTTYCRTAYYKIMSNIYLENIEWVPIGLDTSHYFGGVLLGNGKTIYNMKITGNRIYNGLFGIGNNARIEELGIRDCNISPTVTVKNGNSAFFVGGIMAYGSSNSQINKCFVSSATTFLVNVTVISIDAFIYSIAGYSTINNCWSDYDISTSRNTTNGWLQPFGLGVNVYQCYSLGDIFGNTSNSGASVEVCGLGYNSVNSVYLGNTLSATGNSSGTMSSGIATNSLTNCYCSSATVFVGTATARGTSTCLDILHTESFWKTASNWNTTTGSVWDFDDIWYWDSTTNLPQLRAFSNSY